MEKNLLYIMLNRACNCTCEICCTESNPDCTEKLDYEMVKKFIENMTEDKNLEYIVFTGGEPFLYYEDLIKYIALVGVTGKRIACITNGFWAEELEEAYEKLIELKEKGLSEIIISYDYYHSKFITPRTINNAIRAANKADITSYLQVIPSKRYPLREWMDQIENIDMTSNTLFQSCIPEGYAKTNLSEEDYIRNITPTNQICQSNNKMLIKYDGTIIPCIYPGMLNSGIKIGSYEQLDYLEAKQIIDEDILIHIIRNYGFDRLIEYAKQELNIKIPDKIVSRCELCGILFSKDNVDKFYEHFNIENKELIIDSLWQQEEVCACKTQV